MAECFRVTDTCCLSVSLLPFDGVAVTVMVGKMAGVQDRGRAIRAGAMRAEVLQMWQREETLRRRQSR